ncbi:MAG: Asp23/Gls24 family envelope stress response protein [Eubacterium sp.]|jgi:uncharacterized alkaline shock family protein YloU|nr:Asp23/Gls24 family envelope stress response protein [Eubacterium sp.]
MDTFEYIHTEDLSEENISDTVIAVCAINATLRTKGVVSMTGGFTDTLSENILGKELLSKGVKVDQDDNGIILDVYVVIKYGSKIPQVAWDIQENVKNEVETMTDKKVAAVNIHVQKIQLAEKKRGF